MLLGRRSEERQRSGSKVTLSTSGIPLRLGRTPKKRGPFQAVPVIARAMVGQDSYVLSPQRKPSATTILRKGHPFANDFSADLVVFHI